MTASTGLPSERSGSPPATPCPASTAHRRRRLVRGHGRSPAPPGGPWWPATHFIGILPNGATAELCRQSARSAGRIVSFLRKSHQIEPTTIEKLRRVLSIGCVKHALDVPAMHISGLLAGARLSSWPASCGGPRSRHCCGVPAKAAFGSPFSSRSGAPCRDERGDRVGPTTVINLDSFHPRAFSCWREQTVNRRGVNCG